jgi:thiamine biosynthesis lipoprotein
MAIDLGGIAKGYAVDLALTKLAALGFADVMVEAGGDLRAAASELTEGQRNIWVRHPRKPDQFFARFAMSSGAVATSGDYERFFEHEGRRYHHILNPRTGYPAGTLSGEIQTVGATVTAPTSMLADAFATAIFVLGPERGIALANRLEEIEAMIIFFEQGNLRWRASNEFMNKLKILNDEENE